MSIWEEIVGKTLARKVLTNEMLRRKSQRRAKKRGPQPRTVLEDKQKQRRAEYLREVGRIEPK